MNNKLKLTSATIIIDVIIAGDDCHDWLQKNWMTVMKEQQPEAHIDYEPLNPELHCYSDNDIPYNGINDEMPISAYIDNSKWEI